MNLKINNRLLNNILWPIAIMSFLHRIFWGFNGVRTDDFTTVYKAVTNFLNHEEVYNENLLSYSPHYLYPPSGTLLLSPIGFIGNSEAARWTFIIINALAIVFALYFLVRIFNLDHNSFIFPLLIVGSFFTEAVTNTLAFTNVNGIVFLCEVLFFYGVIHNKNILIGVVLGITFSLKPVLLPFLLILLILKKWKSISISILIPIILNIIARFLSQDATIYFKKTVKYLMEARGYYNSSLSGFSIYYDIAKPIELLLKLLVLIFLIYSLYYSYKYLYKADFNNWLLTTSGLLLCFEFLFSSLGQGYYSILLIPLIISVFYKNSIMRIWIAWLSVYLFTSLDNWHSTLWPAFGRTIDYSRFTVGWFLLMYSAFIYFFILNYKNKIKA